MTNLTIYRCLECRELIEDKDLLLHHVKEYAHTKGFEEVEIPIITERDKTIKKVASEIAGSLTKSSIQEVPKLKIKCPRCGYEYVGNEEWNEKPYNPFSSAPIKWEVKDESSQEER